MSMMRHVDRLHVSRLLTDDSRPEHHRAGLLIQTFGESDAPDP